MNLLERFQILLDWFLSFFREFSCFFKLVDPEKEHSTPIPETRDLGFMLYDMDFDADLQNPPALFYRAKMENGVIIVPPKDSEEVLR